MPFTRPLLLFAILGFSYVAVDYVQSGYEVEVQPPAVPLESIPMQLGQWTGEAVELADETAQVLRAHSHINRIYRDPIGREISLHIGIWTNPEYGVSAPHHPTVCYPAAGWEIMSRQGSEVSTAAGSIPAEMIHFQREGAQVVTAHWYQIGDLRYTSSDNIGTQSLRMWGRHEWPCTVKVLLQTRSGDISAAEPVLRSFAEQLSKPLSKL